MLDISPCTHEEVDSSIMLHVADACHQGHRKILIRTFDSDVVVLATRCFVLLGNMQEELWGSF